MPNLNPLSRSARKGREEFQEGNISSVLNSACLRPERFITEGFTVEGLFPQSARGRRQARRGAVRRMAVSKYTDRIDIQFGHPFNLLVRIALLFDQFCSGFSTKIKSLLFSKVFCPMPGTCTTSSGSLNGPFFSRYSTIFAA